MMKSNKAITLIALIITIIVLLILAGVTINMVLGDNGLINKAKTSVAKYENAQERENGVLAGYEAEIDNYTRDTVTLSTEQYNNMLSRIQSLEGKYKSGNASYGDIDAYGSKSANITFEQPLENNNYSVIVTTTSANPYWSYIAYTIINKTANGFTILACNNANAQATSVTVNWMLTKN